MTTTYWLPEAWQWVPPHCYTNDHMVSFHAETPSGFQVDYGHGGVEIDGDTWQVETYLAASAWGQRVPVVSAASGAAAV